MRIADLTNEDLDHEVRWYAQVLPLEGQVVVDVGANVGRLSEQMWRLIGGRSDLHSIEPIAENVSEIERRRDDLDAKRWFVHPCAVTTRDATVSLQISEDVTEGLDAAVVDAGRARVDRQVPGRRLGSVVPDATVVKLDVEGHEYAILDDTLATMPAIRAYAIEFHRVSGRPLERALAALADHRYELLAAGRRANDPAGPWVSASIPPTLDWSRIPVARTYGDGSEFKMLHVIARRPMSGPGSSRPADSGRSVGTR